MQPAIKVINYGYFIIINKNEEKFYDDPSIAGLLGISLRKYNEILESCNAYEKNGQLFFEWKKEAEAALEILMPYIIMASLKVGA